MPVLTYADEKEVKWKYQVDKKRNGEKEKRKTILNHNYFSSVNIRPEKMYSCEKKWR